MEKKTHNTPGCKYRKPAESGAVPLNLLLAAWMQALYLLIGPQPNTTKKMGINSAASTTEPNMATVRVLCVLYISVYTSNSNDAS